MIIAFINSLNDESDNSIYDSFNSFINEQRNVELEVIITKHKLKPDETRNFINSCFQQKFLKTNGTEIDDILPAMSRFTTNKFENRIKKSSKSLLTCKLILISSSTLISNQLHFFQLH